MPKDKFDGVEIEVPNGVTVLQACELDPRIAKRGAALQEAAE